MATIRKRKGKKGISYQVRVRVTGHPDQVKTFSRLEDAREFVRVEEGRISSTRANPRKKSHHKTVADLFERYQNCDEFRNLKTRDGRQVIIDWWVARIGKVKLTDLDAEMIDDQLAKMEKRGLAAQTINNQFNCLSKALSMGRKSWHWLSHNPADGVQRRSGGKQRERTIKPGEWEDLLSAAQELGKKRPGRPAKQLENFLRVSFGTSARKGELTGLRWEYIRTDLKNDEGVEYGTAKLVDTKNGATRTIILVNGALKAIRDQEQRFRQDSWPWVFVGSSPRHPCNFDTVFRDARTLAGIKPDHRGENICIHSIRHTVATELGDSGATEFEIMAVTGHKTSSQVKRYVKDNQDRALRALLKRERGA